MARGVAVLRAADASLRGLAVPLGQGEVSQNVRQVAQEPVALRLPGQRVCLAVHQGRQLRRVKSSGPAQAGRSRTTTVTGTIGVGASDRRRGGEQSMTE